TTRFVMLTRDRKPGDLAFDERQFQPADSGRLARAVNVRDAGLLKLIDSHIAVLNHASQQLSQLDIRHEMIATRKIITRDFLTMRQRHAFDLTVPVRRHDPGSTQISNTTQLSLQTERLRRLARETDGKLRELP